MSSALREMPDRIAEMLKGSTILITGATGFIGKVLLEKILRCADVKTIYLLLRDKKEKTCNERMNDILNNVLFDSLRKKNLDALKKCKPISGDVSSVDLGISKEDRKSLQEEVDFIFHSAAITRFDETVRSTIRINTRGTKYMLDLAKECRKLKVFVYVSTAYSHPQETVTEEKAYKTHTEASEVLSLIEFTNNEEELQRLLGDFPNSYTFSKALAEDLVVQDMENVPAIIVRPSMVSPIKNDPLPGWYNSLQGASGFLTGAGKGVIRSMYLKVDCRADFIPCDSVVNGILASAWNYHSFDKSQRFYNLTASTKNNKTWGEIIAWGEHIAKYVVPFNNVLWCPGGFRTQIKILHIIYTYLFQIIPAILIDFLLYISGHKPFLYKIQKRVQEGSAMVQYYLFREWEFINNRILEIQKRMNKTEKAIYAFDCNTSMDYMTQCVLGSRRYIFKETDDMLPAARRKMKILLTIDFIVKSLFVMAILYYFYKWILQPLADL